ncbi:MAG: hypothetical protein AAF371_03210 [Pseudomonadota bacterium]
MLRDVEDEDAAVDYIDGLADGDIGPGTIAFIPAGESSTGDARLAVAYEVSGETVLFDLAEADRDGNPPPPANLPQAVIDTGAFYLALLDRAADDARGIFWADEGLSHPEPASVFLTSGKLDAADPGPGIGWIVDLRYDHVLGRDADAAAPAHSVMAIQYGFPLSKKAFIILAAE